MKIRLLTCPSPFLMDEKVFPPLGLMAVGTALRLQGHDVTITDEPDDSRNFGIGPTTAEYPHALGILRQIKCVRERNRVIIGGPHAIANPHECVADGFDAVAIGDGENITGDTFAARGVVDLGRRPLSEYPMIDRGLVDIHGYRYEIAGRDATTILTTRGCPYHCGFCAKPDDRVRFRNVEDIEKEIVHLKSHWEYEALMFFDDTFIVRKDRAEGICKSLKRHKVLWRCFVRGDLVVKHGREFVTTMARSGCVEVGIGIESGSSKILQTIQKGESIEDIEQAIFMLRQAGIRVKGFFVVGLPGEDRDTLAETQRFIDRVPLTDADFCVFQPYRGSPIWDHRAEYDIDWPDIPAMTRFYKGRKGEYTGGVSTSELSSEDIVNARDALERHFECQ